MSEVKTLYKTKTKNKKQKQKIGVHQKKKTNKQTKNWTQKKIHLLFL